MLRRKMDLPDCLRQVSLPESLGSLQWHVCLLHVRRDTYGISYALSLTIKGELGGLAPCRDGRCGQDLVEGDGHCGFFLMPYGNRNCEICQRK